MSLLPGLCRMKKIAPCPLSSWLLKQAQSHWRGNPEQEHWEKRSSTGRKERISSQMQGDRQEDSPQPPTLHRRPGRNCAAHQARPQAPRHPAWTQMGTPGARKSQGVRHFCEIRQGGHQRRGTRGEQMRRCAPAVTCHPSPLHSAETPERASVLTDTGFPTSSRGQGVKSDLIDLKKRSYRMFSLHLSFCCELQNSTSPWPVLLTVP